MGIFSQDNAIGRFLYKLGNWVILNFLVLLCCMPIVTIGPAITALFAVSLKLVRGEDLPVGKSFFAAFKENFKKGLLIHLILALCGAALLLSLYYIWQLQKLYAFYSYFKWVICVVAVVYAMVLTYVYPLLAAFENSIRNTLRNALLLSITHLIGTILMLAMTVGVVALCFLFTPLTPFALFFYMFCGVAVTAVIQSQLFVKIFDQYSNDEE